MAGNMLIKTFKILKNQNFNILVDGICRTFSIFKDNFYLSMYFMFVNMVEGFFIFQEIKKIYFVN